MKNNATTMSVMWAAALVLAGEPIPQQPDPAGNRLTMSFSDPSRPGTVIVSLLNGSITVRASSGRDVVVTSEGVRQSRAETSGRAQGLRRLSQPVGLSITEENNVMTVRGGRLHDDTDVELQVPARTNLKLSTMHGDEIVVERAEGDLEVTSMNGEIILTDVSGSVVAHASNGDVTATLRQAAANKPMAFTSLNGDVDVTLPASVRANLRLRSDRGDVYTDFDIQIQQQPAAASSTATPPAPPRPPLPPVPPGGDPNGLKDLEREAREIERQARQLARSKRFDADTAIHGSVNGGGPEFELRTFNGDVYLRRGK